MFGGVEDKGKDDAHEEFKGVMPSHWVEESLRAVYWPLYGCKTLSSKAKISIKQSFDWFAFHLVKMKQCGR
jgi:hypothetical protein